MATAQEHFAHNPTGYQGTYENNQWYGQGSTGYRDDAFAPPEPKAGDATAEDAPYSTPPLVAFPAEKSSSALKNWRHDEHGNVWTKGSRGRCCGRWFFFVLLTLILLLFSIVPTLGLWIRPPNVIFEGVVSPSNNSVSIQSGGFTINLSLNISVNNPNYFSLTFQRITAVATYPIGNSSSLGGGTLSNVKFPSHSNTSIAFPFVLNYQTSSDPSLVIASDIANKCGVTGGTTSDITVNYALTLKIAILATINPTYHSSASFPCPLTASEIQGLLGGISTG